jgi:hypothetical protein
MGFPVWRFYRRTMAKKCLSSQEGHSQCPPPSPNRLTSLQIFLSLLSLLTIFYITLSLLYCLLSLPIILTVLLGIGLGATSLFVWTQAQKLLLVGFFYLIATLLWGLTLVIHTPLTSHSFATSCRAFCQFHSTHNTGSNLYRDR